jgi:hypothetical protein
MANAVRGRWKTVVQDGLSITTQHDNANFTPPVGAAWARLTLQPASTDQLELGSSQRTFRTVARVVASIFIPLATGDAAALSLADSASASFRAQTVDGITYLTPSVRAVGRSGEWWQVNLEIPFTTEALA